MPTGSALAIRRGSRTTDDGPSGVDDTARRPKKKVKTGCLTCKFRKVRCDEAHPSCTRCLSTGRNCDGYGIWSEGRHRMPETIQTSVAIEVSRKSSLNTQERGYLEWCTCHTSVKLPGLFGSHFWDTLILQACDSEQAVLNAVLALGCAYKVKHSPGEPSSDERSMLSHYNKAIHHLEPAFLFDNSRQQARVALITCMLFIYLEILRGN